jgi:hypothetical protein
MGFWSKYSLKTWLPILISSVVLLANLFKQRRGSTAKLVVDLHLNFVRIRSHWANFLGVMVIGLHTAAISATMTAFNCSRQPNGSYVNRKDPSVSCFDADWFKNLWLVSFSILFYVLVIPGALIYVYLKHRNHHGSLEFLKGYKLLIAPYKSSYYYWELVVLLKRTFFIVSQDFLAPFGYEVRYGVSMIVLLTFFWIETFCMPYAVKDANSVNTA